ncbi:MAG: site-2 protease family protein [Deltaproteobacteria bacterium]|nr:site-2 protease family protein [Deltaproteobacteria bacterium]
MARGIKLFKVLGIRISVDYSWFIVFALFAWSLAYGYFPSKHPGLGSGAYMAMGAVASLLLFACVLAHELAHSYTSNKLGLAIKEITLFIFGGVARLTKEPEDAATELKIAIAGPLASAALALIFWGVSSITDGIIFAPAQAIIEYLAMINMALLIFNMIPGFPLDGGRVLRSVWWGRTGDIKKATRAASAIGKGFAVFLILTGVFYMFMGNFAGLWYVLIGVFLRQSAHTGYRDVLMKDALHGVKVKDLMTRGAVTLDETATLSDVIEKYFFKYHYVSFPVVSAGRLVGMLSVNAARVIEKEKWPSVTAGDVMARFGPDDALSPEDFASAALVKMEDAGRLPVAEGGRLLGIISRRDILKAIEFKAEFKR